MEKKEALNQDFNISTDVPTTVLELAKMIWDKIHPDKEFKYICDDPYQHDVGKSIPSVKKAKDLLEFRAEIKLGDALDEIIPWMKKQIHLNNI